MARHAIAKYVAISLPFWVVTFKKYRVLNYYNLLDDVPIPTIRLHTSYAPTVHLDVTSDVGHRLAVARVFSTPLPYRLPESLPQCWRPAPAFPLNSTRQKVR
ncbi:hypothetical protein BLA13014_00883 [Burkholderia aenigmatica]|uniref:Uncharacterized protein n=1 Tax=Burkholderia aenigmatica TaxID=2015348 RepID=A0A6P2I299_9BURK|nr:hypothetical protein BLA13014_00883 [Burkholderia aenigmatica]